MMQLRLKVPFLIIIGAIIVSVLATFVAYRSQLEVIESARRQQLEMAAAVIQATLQSQNDKAAIQARLIANLPPVREAFRSGDRDALMAILTDSGEVTQQLYGMTTAQFYSPPATVFRHLFNPDITGEDHTSFRQMILSAHTREEVQLGLEIGRRGLNTRAVIPVVDATGMIGVFETGINFTTVPELVKSTIDFEVGVFVEEERMSVATSLPAPESDRFVGTMRNVDATDWQTIRSLVTADSLRTVNDVVYTSTQVENNSYGVAYVPLLDFSGEQVGVIVAARNFNHFQHQANAAVINLVVLLIVEVSVLAFSALLLVNGLVLRPLITVGEKMRLMADGEFDQDVSDLAKREDEIGELARNFQRLQNYLAETQEQELEGVR